MSAVHSSTKKEKFITQKIQEDEKANNLNNGRMWCRTFYG